MGARRLVLIRHGQTDYNATGRMQGQLDTQLSQRGREQARHAASVLADWNVSAVVSSDLKRAQDTAQILAESWGVDVRTDARLRETDLGAWQGGSHDDIDRDYPGQRAYWRHDSQWSPPGGETRLQVAERAYELVRELMEQGAFGPGTPDGSGTVVLVAHGGTIGALTSRLLDLPIDHYHLFSGLGNVHWSQLCARPKFRGDTGATTPPAIDGSQVPVVQGSGGTWFEESRWHLEGWNISASMAELAAGTIGASNPDEGMTDQVVSPR